MENLSDESSNVEQKLVDFAVSIAKEAGELTLSLFNDLNLEIIKKIGFEGKSENGYIFKSTPEPFTMLVAVFFFIILKLLNKF